MRLASALFVSVVMAWGSATAAEFPTKPITVIVPYPPGGVTDLVGRIVASGLQERLDTTVVVENRPGGSGIVGTQAFMNAEHDGHTLLVGGFGSHVLPPLIMSNYPIDVRQSLEPVSMVAEFINVMIVNPELPVDSVEEFIAHAKENPGKLNFASSGVGASNHMTAELFMREADIEMVHVPYKGEGESIADLRGGAIDVIFSNLPSAAGHIESGNVKPLAVTSSYRSDVLPELPTIAEAALPEFAVTSWVGIYGPKGMPEEATRILGEAISAHVKEEATQAELRKVRFEPVGLNAEEFAEFYTRELDRWQQVVESTGVRN